MAKPDGQPGSNQRGGSDKEDPLVTQVRLRGERHRQARQQGEPSVARRLAQIGVLGWLIVTPMLLGLFGGRWLDHRLGSGLFWTAPLMLLGLAIGGWSGWNWMRKP